MLLLWGGGKMWGWLRQTFIDPSERSEPGPERLGPAANSGSSVRPVIAPVNELRGHLSPDPTSYEAPRSKAPPFRARPPSRLRQISCPHPADVANCTVVALDFETANARRSNPCAVGLVWLHGGQVAHRAYRLVRPLGNRFDPGNIRVHGIYPGDVDREPEFPTVWAELAPLVEGRVLLAHNAAFDTGVLVDTLQAYGLRVPELRTVCTLAAARRVWPYLPRHGLHDVAAHLGIEFRHHHALEDAEASAAIGLSAAKLLGLSDVSGLLEALRSARQWPVDNARPASRTLPVQHKRPARYEDFDPSQPLHGKTVVVTGVLRSMTREEARAAIAVVGGRTAANVSAQVDYVVTGFEPGGSKLSRAQVLQSGGSGLQVINEDRLLSLLGHPIG